MWVGLEGQLYLRQFVELAVFVKVCRIEIHNYFS